MSATPKSAGPRKPQSALLAGSSAAVPGLLDAFPVWQDQPATEKEFPGKYEDPLGTSLPAASLPFCDAWKRTEELVHGAPLVPLVCLKPLLESDKKGSKSYAGSRELEGKLYAGHETFDWLLAVISFVISAEKYIKKGDFLWELILPKDKEGLPVRSPSGKYRVKLFILDSWRTVTIDDRIPVDLFGRALLIGSRPLQLWPLLLCKAILKVMAVYKCLEMPLPHEVAAFQMLTGWPQEDLVDALKASSLVPGALYDRLEEVLGGPLRSVQDMPAIASCCLVKRSKPQRAPPRLVVLTGPSAVGRSQLISKLVAEYPDKFAVTVSHTSRPPREHEVEGRDYYFTSKQTLLAEVRAKKFLEAARVNVHSRPCNTSAAAAAAAPGKPLSYWYGTSLATVREVAATGKLCIMSLDMQGAGALRSNKRIDGLYLYVTTSDPQLLAKRQKQRLSEASSTISKRLAWASQQVSKSQQQGVFDATIKNTTMDEVYANLKEAISTLSPIIRNRLRGLPAYVLDYSDLIPPNSVEKPFLKPVILAGPNNGERRKLLEMLVAEFPDVFAFPRQHTTRSPDEHQQHVGVDGDELQLLTDKPGETPRTGPRTADSTNQNGAMQAVEGSSPAQQCTAGAAAASDGCNRTSGVGSDGTVESQVLGPPPVVMTKEEFESAVHAGSFLEYHADLFKHPTMVHKHGHSLEHVKEVIHSGKLPLIELEAEGAEAVKIAKGVDCLTIFLAPPSIEVHEQRLREWATESDKEVAERQEVAADELAAVHSNNVYDQVIVNDDFDSGFKSLKLALSKYRPDLIQAADEDDEAAQAAKKAAAANQAVPLLVLGPAGGGREQLVHQVLQRYPHRFALPKRLTDKKPGKADKELSPDTEYVKPDVLSKLAAQGQFVWSQPDPATAATIAITLDAVLEVATAGKMAVLDIGAASTEQLQNVRQHSALKGAFAVYVCRKAALTAGIPSTGTAAAASQGQIEKALAQLREHVKAGSVQAVVDDDDPEEGFAQLQEPLSAASPWAMPPLLLPLVVAAPFGSGKRVVLQKLCNLLPHVFAVPQVVTSRPRGSSNSSTTDMDFVDPQTAAEMQLQGKFIVHQQVLGYAYGITAASVRKLQAAGKLPLLDLDRVEDVARLRAAGFQATYIYLQPPSLEQLQKQVSANIMANPPLHYEPEDAAQAAAAEAVREASEAAAQSHLFDAVLTHKPQEPMGTVGQLSEVLHEHYPTAVPSSFVWGYGRPLWDISSRVHGFKPLKIILLGPAASGKSTQCAILASRFGISHVNAGDLLYAEVSAKTTLGLEAKQYMDSSKTVPDRMLMTLVLRRLEATDCQSQGWALDGFPHTRQQAEMLAEAGHVPDKVILLQGAHALLLDRVKHRRIDYVTGKVYHIAEPGALSAAVTPVRSDGTPDTDILSRLAVRHDDSLENVANRLVLWDRQVQGLCAVYEDVLIRLPAAGSVDDVTARAEAFIKLEATHGTGNSSPGNIWPIIPSWQLEELTYRIVAIIKYRRQQLVQLQQLDGKLAWCNLKELSSNCSCLLLTHNPSTLPVVKSYKRLDSSTIAKPQLISVSSPEPFRLLACLSMGPQHLPMPPGPCTKKVVVLAGPAGSGRSRLAEQLLQDFSNKLMPAPLLTNRTPHMMEVQSSTHKQQLAAFVAPTNVGSRQSGLRMGSSPTACASVTANNLASAATAGSMQASSHLGTELLQFVPEPQFKLLKNSNQLVGIHSHLGHSYGVAAAALEAIWNQSRAAVVVGSLALAEKLRKQSLDTQVICLYINANMDDLDVQLRLSPVYEEERLQQLLQDASHQQQVLLVMLQQQADAVKAEQAQQQNTMAPGGVQPATAVSTPSGASRTAKEGSLAKGLQLQQMATLQQQQSQLDVSSPTSQPTKWLQVVNNTSGQQQACYTMVKAALAEHWQAAQRHLPGLLLVQRYATSSSYNNSGSSRPNSAAMTSYQSPASAATTCSACLDGDKYSQACTVVRLQSVTSASALLELPRGQHVLQLQCPPQLLHSVTFYATGEFVLDEAAKLLPSTMGLHVTTHDGRHDALAVDSRQLLFRYLIKPAEPCVLSADFKTSSSAVQACSRLLLVDNSSREVNSHVLNQPSQLQLVPSDKGYILLALAQPDVDVPAGTWSLTITSNKALPAPQELPVQRQVLYEGVYSSNAQAVLGRFVISPTTCVHLAVLAELSRAAGTTSDSPQAQAAAIESSRSGSKSTTRQNQTQLAYSLRVFDTGVAKEVAWGADYRLVAEVVSAAGGDGRAVLPNLQLQPGKYLVVLHLQPDRSRQWVDPVTGGTEPAPQWQVLLMPSMDEKSCPITSDDAYDRYFKCTVDSWQQQAAQVAAVTAAVLSSSRPGSREASSASGGVRVTIVATKDRPKQAQLALERYQQAEQQSASAPTGLTVSIPGSVSPGHAVAGSTATMGKLSQAGGKARSTAVLAAGQIAASGRTAVEGHVADGTGTFLLDTSTSGSLSATPRNKSGSGVLLKTPSTNNLGVPTVAVRQVKGGELLVMPAKQLKHLKVPNQQADGTLGGTGDCPVTTLQPGLPDVSLLGPVQLAERLLQLQQEAEREKAQLTAMAIGGGQSSAPALQEQQATEFIDWRNTCLREQQAVTCRKQHLVTALAGPAAEIPALVPTTPTIAARKQDKASKV